MHRIVTLLTSLALSSAATAEIREADVVRQFATQAEAAYSDASQQAQALREQVLNLVITPSPQQLELTRQSWLNAQIPYHHSQAFHFDEEQPVPLQVEYREEPVKADLSLDNQPPSIGRHDLEQLNNHYQSIGTSLWQIVRTSDSVATQELLSASEQLVQQLNYRHQQWQPGGAARQQWLAQSTQQGIAEILSRLNRWSTDNHPHHSASLNESRHDHALWSQYQELKGIWNVYRGQYEHSNGKVLRGPSLSALVSQRDADADRQMNLQMQVSLSHLKQLMQHQQSASIADQRSQHRLNTHAARALSRQNEGIESVFVALNMQSRLQDLKQSA